MDKEKENLNKKLSECEKLKKEYLAGWQRARADFLNFKKEETERVGQMLRFANQNLLLQILLILDNLELFAKNKQIEQGFWQSKKQLQGFLKNEGIEEIQGVGERFDPNLHEAVKEVKMKSKKSGTIVEIVQKGYKLNGKVIRPARVKITK